MIFNGISLHRIMYDETLYMLYSCKSLIMFLNINTKEPEVYNILTVFVHIQYKMIAKPCKNSALQWHFSSFWKQGTTHRTILQQHIQCTIFFLRKYKLYGETSFKLVFSKCSQKMCECNPVIISLICYHMEMSTIIFKSQSAVL